MARRQKKEAAVKLGVPATDVDNGELGCDCGAYASGLLNQWKKTCERLVN